MTLYGIAVEGWKQIEPLHGVPVDNFCIDGRFHIGISCDAPTPGNGWHISVAPQCWCNWINPTPIVGPDVFRESVAKAMALIGKHLHWLGPSPMGIYHWDEIRKLRSHV